MLKYRAPTLIRSGFIGVVLVALIVAIGLAPQVLVSLATTLPYQAMFTEAGGLMPGNDVKVSGVAVGTVKAVSLNRGKVLVDFTVKASVRLGSDTTAHIKIGSLLGRRVLTLESAGAHRLDARAVIPLTRTSSPYSLTDALSDLTTNSAGTNTDQLNLALDTLSTTLDRIAPQLAPTFDGLSRLSQIINARNESLRELLGSTSSVSGVLAERSQQMNTLILNANTLLTVLVDRREAIVGLLQNISVVATQLSGLVHDNEAELAPTLDHLNSVTAVLQNNRDNLAKSITGVRKVAQTNGESVAGGPYANVTLGNLLPGSYVQPFIDWAFRVQPRTLFPLPTCGETGDCYSRKESPYIPQGPRK